MICAVSTIVHVDGSVAAARIGWSYYQKHTSRDARALSNLPTFFGPLHTGTLEASGTTPGKSRTWSGSHRNSRTSRDTAWGSTGREGPDESMTAFRTNLRDADAIQPSGSSSRCSAFGAPEHSARRWCFLQCRDAQLGRGRCPLCHHCRLEREGGGDPRL